MGYDSIFNFISCPISGKRMKLSECEDFIITEDGSVKYPIEDGIPIILIERAIRIGNVL